MRKLISIFGAAAFVILPLCSFLLTPAPVHAYTEVGLIKGSGDTVYWKSSDGKRYVFPTYKTFASWWPETAPTIQLLSDSELGSIQIGGNMVYRPGVRMVKITTDPKVYAVSRYGVLRWITSETLAAYYYGSNWASQIDDVPDAFFVNYTIGSSISSASDYHPWEENSLVSTPEANIKPTTQPTPTNPVNTGARFTNWISKSTLVSGEVFALQATLTSPNNPTIKTIDILDPRTGDAIATCRDTNICWAQFNLSIRYGVTNIIFHARGYDASGNKIAEEWFPMVSLTQTPSASRRFNLSTDPMNVSAGGYVTLVGSMPDANVNPTITRIEIVDPRTNTVVQTCYNQISCSARLTMNIVGGITNIIFHLRSYDASGNLVTDEMFPLVTISQTVTPTPSVTSPTSNQVLTAYPRLLTVKWANDSQKRHTIELDCDNCTSFGSWSNLANYTTDNYAGEFSGITLPGDNGYRVRVKATNAEGVEGPWSNYVYFTFSTVSNVAVPIITSPVANQTYNIFPRTLEINWAYDLHPRHNLEITCDYCSSATNPFSNPKTYVVTDYANSYSLVGAGNNQYRVRVQAVDRNGETSAWSDYVYFRFGPPASLMIYQRYVYADYQVVGKGLMGTLALNSTTCSGPGCSFNFQTKTYGNGANNSFYVLTENGVTSIFCNNNGQAGAVKLSGDVDPPAFSSGVYNRYGVALNAGDWYAVYDSANNQYIKFHVISIQDSQPVLL